MLPIRSPLSLGMCPRSKTPLSGGGYSARLLQVEKTAAKIMMCIATIFSWRAAASERVFSVHVSTAFIALSKTGSSEEELTAGSDEKTQRSPAGNRTQGLANSSRTLYMNHWATKPQRELRVNSRLSPSCQFFFHYEVTRIARATSMQRPTKTRWI